MDISALRLLGLIQYVTNEMSLGDRFTENLDDKMGEEVCAWVQIKDGEQLTEDEVKDFCQGQITHFKIPGYVRFVSEYPMTVTGKIRKIEMREMMVKELAS